MADPSSRLLRLRVRIPSGALMSDVSGVCCQVSLRELFHRLARGTRYVLLYKNRVRIEHTDTNLYDLTKRKNKGPIKLQAFLAHHTPTLASCTGKHSINVLLSANLYLFTSAEMTPNFFSTVLPLTSLQIPKYPSSCEQSLFRIQ